MAKNIQRGLQKLQASFLLGLVEKIPIAKLSWLLKTK